MTVPEAGAAGLEAIDMAGEEREVANNIWRSGSTVLQPVNQNFWRMSVWLVQATASTSKSAISGVIPGPGRKGIVKLENLTNKIDGYTSYKELPSMLADLIDEHTFEFAHQCRKYGVPVSLYTDKLTGEKCLFFKSGDADMVERSCVGLLRAHKFDEEKIAMLLAGEVKELPESHPIVGNRDTKKNGGKGLTPLEVVGAVTDVVKGMTGADSHDNTVAPKVPGAR